MKEALVDQHRAVGYGNCWNTRSGSYICEIKISFTSSPKHGCAQSAQDLVTIDKISGVTALTRQIQMKPIQSLMGS